MNSNIGSNDERRESNRVEKVRVRESDLSSQFKLAYLALTLVAKGASEREAVQRAATSYPGLNSVKREALALVLGSVSEQDVLDIDIQNVMSQEKIGVTARSLFRLAAYAIRRLGAKGQIRQIEHILRAIAPNELLPKLEFLIVSLLALDSLEPPSGLGDSDRVALETHHPVWWVNYCFRNFGRGEAIALLSPTPRPRYLRVNSLRNRGRTTLPEEIGVLAKRLTRVLSTSGVYVVAGSLSAFAGFFSSGLLQMQDLASYLAVTAGDPRPGEKVLDLCAAPGAKTAAIAQKMKNQGTVVSVDYSPVRMKAWRRETQRLGVKIADSVIGDAARLSLRESFDLTLIDPPCTGTGVLDRNPRMKWHLSPRSVDRYSILQRRLLESSAATSSEGGRILYCTCSLTVEENERVISGFLKSHPEFETRPILEHYGSPGLMGLADCRRFYPHRDQTA
ncbi:MAG TPA: RsmB/NOP family class I SAM-dependent RNA methyltransferase, partial [Candidatus Angelobacter sp.]|nr:RsmB/NOP family class I SAM-dependent RNA methyltransferase [Candidatus Angelobacter sp.]